MAFRCDKCGNVQPPKSRPTKVATVIRKKFYPAPVAEVYDEETETKTMEVVGRKGYGHEIAQEKNMCQNCASTSFPKFI